MTCDLAATGPSSTFTERAAGTARVPIEPALVEVLERYVDTRGVGEAKGAVALPR